MDAQHDPDFGRTELKYKLENPPYYGVKTYPYVLLTKGGPAMNVKRQVLDGTGKVIRGLYLAGEVIGGANIGGHGSIGGLASTMTYVWGRVAGQNAAEYALLK